jgi:hypothetical protein
MYDADKTSQMIKETSFQYEETRKEKKRRKAQSLKELEEQVLEDLKARAEEDDQIYDPEHEAEIARRLAKLDDLSRSEFYRIRTNRKNDGVLSARELDLLTLEAMERSYNYHNGNTSSDQKKTKKFSFGGTE